MPLEDDMNTKMWRYRAGSEAHMGVYVNESGTLGDMAEVKTFAWNQRSWGLALKNLQWCSIKSYNSKRSGGWGEQKSE
jgi:hypothetical protein